MCIPLLKQGWTQNLIHPPSLLEAPSVYFFSAPQWVFHIFPKTLTEPSGVTDEPEGGEQRFVAGPSQECNHLGPFFSCTYSCQLSPQETFRTVEVLLVGGRPKESSDSLRG